MDRCHSRRRHDACTGYAWQPGAVVVATVYTHKLLELSKAGSYRVLGAVSDAIESATRRLTANASPQGSGAVPRHRLDWAYLAKMSAAGQPFVDGGVLPIPNGAPI